MILMIDNYDSFVYNLVQYIEELGEAVVVKRNNEIKISDIEELNPEVIVLSPGPCSPKEAGICIDIVEHFKGKKTYTRNLFRSPNYWTCFWRRYYKSTTACAWKSI